MLEDWPELPRRCSRAKHRKNRLDMSGKYDGLSQAQLIELLEKRDRTKRLGLVWERDEIAADQAIDENFIACELLPELSDKAAPWANMVIEGDNFDALRWLRMTLAGRVKCIYVDPPYNTGNKDWVYNDSYMDAEDRFRQSTWLEFLYRRMMLARDLLAENGVMFVSINDEQRALLELMMQEAMPGMRIGSFVWRTRTGAGEGGDHFYSANHEHVLVFAKQEFGFLGSPRSFADYKFDDGDGRGPYAKENMTVAVSYDDTRAGTAFYPIQNPETGVWYPCNPDRVWAYVSKKLSVKGARVKTKYIEDFIAEGRVAFPKNDDVRVFETKEALISAIREKSVPLSGRAPMLRENLPPVRIDQETSVDFYDFWVGKPIGFGTLRLKKYRNEFTRQTQPLSSWITPKSETDTIEQQQNAIVSGTNDEGSKHVKNLFGFKAFNYAKPVSLVRELVRQSTGSGDIVLDFFAGSASTAQAVMELNAEDGGDRRFIMVSSTEATVEESDKNLCRDVTAERIRRLNASKDPKYADFVAPFAYLRTHEIAFEDLDYDLAPEHAWAALETLHRLPLSIYDATAMWNAHEGEGVTLVMVDRYDPALLDWLRARSRENVFVYTWAPGQLARELVGVEVEIRSVRETLVRGFQQ
ncbi:site-specific DNA-methyltransferase [Phaeobacter sp. JH20_35]